jgi:hypothetical protein
MSNVGTPMKSAREMNWNQPGLLNAAPDEGITGTNGSGYVMANGTSLVDPAGVSPDALLEYCQMQLNGLDSQVDTMMNSQQQQLNEQEAVQQVQTTLESYGTTGPTTQQGMATCYNAFQQAEADLPAGDPMIQQLQAKCEAMCAQYKYTPPASMTGSPADAVAGYQALMQSEPTNQAAFGTLNAPPANTDWQSTTDDISNLASDIKSNSEIQMLQLQDLVSQRQDVIEMSSQMMTSEDNTLLDQAKAIGS